jgi:DNA-binding transcriptional MocR family regulator
MTTWTPELAKFSGPRYAAIANALAADVSAGRLKPGDRLPPHRELAWRLKVTVGTVTRAYTEAERRGLIAGEVGRGTFVRDSFGSGGGGDVHVPPTASQGANFIDLSRAVPADDVNNRTVAATLAEIAGQADFGRLLAYNAVLGSDSQREAAASWLAEWGMAVTPERIAISGGGQNGVVLTLAALARPGDVVLAEQLSYYGIKSAAALLSLRLHGVAIDEHGLVPEALEQACKQLAPKALYCTPTMQNPTAVVMPVERREAVAAICRRYSVAIIEDDIFGFLIERPPPRVASFAPEHSVLITSLSKALAPGLRVGFIATAMPILDRIEQAMRAQALMTTPLMAELAAQLIRSGVARRMAEWQRQEAIARQAIARRVLAGLDVAAHPHGLHSWLRLPEPWRREEFVDAARRRGIGVAPADSFAVGRAPVPHAVRIGHGAARTREELEAALRTIRTVLAETPAPHHHAMV